MKPLRLLQVICTISHWLGSLPSLASWQNHAVATRGKAAIANCLISVCGSVQITLAIHQLFKTCGTFLIIYHNASNPQIKKSTRLGLWLFGRQLLGSVGALAFIKATVCLHQRDGDHPVKQHVTRYSSAVTGNDFVSLAKWCPKTLSNGLSRTVLILSRC